MEYEGDLVSLFGDMPDPRLDRKKLHQLRDILTIAILAVICGAETWDEIEDFGVARYEWLRAFLELPNGVPSHDTFNRVFSMIDPEEFENRFASWVSMITNKLQDHIAIDGKVLRGSGNRSKGKDPLCIVSAWAATSDLVLAHTAVESKSNEITAIPKILDLLHIEGCIISIDAMGCQRDIAQQITNAGGDYVLAVKKNQRTLYEELENFFRQAENINFEGVVHDCHKSYEENRGRKEERVLYVTEDIDWLPMKEKWSNMKSIVYLSSQREVDGKKTCEKRFYISSLPPDAQLLTKTVRNHWGIENNQHWILDVVFNEDKSRIREKTASRNLATLRRLGLNLLKRNAKKASLKRKRLLAGWDERYLIQILEGIF